MQEAFLHYIWRNQRLQAGPWLSTEKEEIQLLHRGQFNSLGGPDFLEAQVRIGPQLWVGHIEVHVRASDWRRHQHQQDPAYQNVILHVVYEEDEVIYRTNGTRMACLELKGRFDEMLYWRYEQLVATEQALPCAPYLKDLPQLGKLEMLDRMALSKLESKFHFFQSLYEQSKGDWETIFYWALAYSLGLKANAHAMLALAQSIDRKWVLRLNSRLSLEALFLGQAGLLENPDPHFDALQKEYHYLRHKFNLEPPPLIWTYGGIRPPAFPDRRIAFLAQAIAKEAHWHKKYLLNLELDLSDLFKIELSPSWRHFYRCQQRSKRSLSTELSVSLRKHLLINLVIPYRFFYGTKVGRAEFWERAWSDLEQLPPEFNKITQFYEQLALPIRSALDSQATLEWYRKLCGPKKCLNCSLGNSLLKDNL